MASLLRYKRHFKLPIRPSAHKLELIAAVKKHFAHHPRKYIGADNRKENSNKY